jgi:NAD+ kinase
VKKIGVLYHPKVQATRDKARDIVTLLRDKGVAVWEESAWDTEKSRAQLGGTDLLITVGGDGTILRAAQIVIPGNVPILSVNLGKLGFMTSLPGDDALSLFPGILDGSGWIDERAMLQVELVTGAFPPRTFHALNDVVVARGEIARLIRIEAILNGQPLATYRADGVIVATATGSTGYALAAGGPVIYPQSGDFLLVPVAPHVSLAQSLVLSSQSTVTLRPDTYLSATFSVDGHINMPIASGDLVTIKKSPSTVKLLRVFPRESFYSSLEGKLRGK